MKMLQTILLKLPTLFQLNMFEQIFHQGAFSSFCPPLKPLQHFSLCFANRYQKNEKQQSNWIPEIILAIHLVKLQKKDLFLFIQDPMTLIITHFATCMISMVVV